MIALDCPLAWVDHLEYEDEVLGKGVRNYCEIDIILRMIRDLLTYTTLAGSSITVLTSMTA